MPDQHDDGLGQTFLEELAWLWRFLRYRSTRIPWRRPTQDEEHRFSTLSPISRFGDFTIAIADFDQKRWIIKERIWSGWPDPPTYAIFVIKDEKIWMAQDFEFWPRAWQKP